MYSYRQIARSINKQLLRKTNILRFAIPNGILLSATLIIVAAGLLIVGFRPTSSKQNVQQKPTENNTSTVSTKTKDSTPVAPSTSASPSASTQPSTTNTAKKGESCSQTEAIFGPILSTDVANDWSTSNIAGESQSEIDYNYNRFLVTAYQSYESSMTEFGCSPVDPAPSPKSPAYTADCQSINGNAAVTLGGQQNSLFDGAENYNSELIADVSHGSMNDSEALSLMNNYINSLNPQYNSDYSSYSSTVQAYSSNGCFTTITYPDVMAQCTSYPCDIALSADNSSEGSASD
jgi:hypothetical protein